MYMIYDMIYITIYIYVCMSQYPGHFTCTAMWFWTFQEYERFPVPSGNLTYK